MKEYFRELGYSVHLLGPNPELDDPWTFSIPNCSITEVTIDQMGGKIVRAGDTSYMC